MFRIHAFATPSDRLLFKVNFILNGPRIELVEFKAVCGPGDNHEPVITIMLPNED